MKDKRKISATVLSGDSRVRRAKKLAEASPPLVADLYLAHLQACAMPDRTDKTKRPVKTRLPAR